MRRSLKLLPVLLAALLSAPFAHVAHAQNPGDDARTEARKIGEEGLAFYDQGMYIDALDRFERADALIKAPTLGLMAARCLEKLGRLVEASERYLQVSRMTLDTGASDVWKKAVENAGKEHQALQPRIPTIEIKVEGEGAAEALVSIDGRPIPKALIGIRTPINPGMHRFDARNKGASTYGQERVSLSEGQAGNVVIAMKPADKGYIPDDPSASGPGGPDIKGSAVPGKPPPLPGPSAESPSAMGIGGDKSGSLDDQTRAAARAIGEEGLSLYDQARYVDALDRFERADELIKAPTLGLMAARSLEKLGRYVESTERYQQVMDMKLPADASETFKNAQSTAAKERGALLPKIPTVEVSVTGPGANEVTTLMLDGRRLPPERFGTSRPISAKLPVDPGDHRLEAQSNSGEAFERFNVSEAGNERVVLTLAPSPNKLRPPPNAKDPAAGQASSSSQQPAAMPPRRGETQKTAAWISLGVGAAGTLLGVITGSVAASIHSDFTDPPCDTDARTCPSSFADQIDTYSTLRPLSTTGFVIGGIGLGLGTVLLLTLPKGGARYSAGNVQITPWIGPTSAGLQGSF